MTTERVWPDAAIPPGETLAETLEALKMSQAELARRIGRPVQAINEIVRGKKQIMAETALAFEAALKVPAHVWLRLEADYQLVRARLAMKKGRAFARRRARLAGLDRRERARRSRPAKTMA